MTVGLIRGEAARDLRMLAATGATRSIRRTLTASTAGALAALGALLGTLAAYLVLVAGSSGDTGTLTPVPFIPLAVIVIGGPVAAFAVGWVASGREPGERARTRIE
jgi:putative ABC transport system permease protein